MSETEPLTPDDCDLRGLEWMPLYGARLFGSDFEAHADDTTFRAGLQIWWSAWNQVPAASLPDDDVALCRLAGLGRDVKTWKRVRPNALRGFVLCADGRLYHRALSVWACEAWERRLKDRERKAKWRAERERRAQRDRDVPETGTETGTRPFQEWPQNGHGDDHRTAAERTERTGEDRTGQESKNHECVESSPPVAASATHTAPRARGIPPTWEPSPRALTDLRKMRPDLVGDWYAQRMQDFRDWCRAEAKTSHDFEATWRGFMRKSKAPPTSQKPRSGYHDPTEKTARQMLDEINASGVYDGVDY